jgi:RNA polymerase sigma-70 factor, ECF subfamily
MGAFERSIPGAMAIDLLQTRAGSMSESAGALQIESLVREHARLVFRIAFSVLRNHADAEDIVQEVFLRVSRHGAKGIEDPKAWLSRIAWRASVDRFRSIARNGQDEFDECVHAPSGHRTGAEFQLISRQTLALLDRLIATLPRKEREALLLTSIDELSGAAAARILGTTETSVRARVFRARQRLAEKLQKITGTSYGS